MNIRHLIIALCLSCSWQPALAQSPAPDAETTPQIVVDYSQPLTIKSGDASHAFKVEVVSTPEAIRQGMMHRESLPQDAGMLFDLGEPRQAGFWMKNCLISLDMLFVASNGKVMAIAHKAVPGSERNISPGLPVKAVLEINGGQAEALGIKPGDRIEFPLFGETTIE